MGRDPYTLRRQKPSLMHKISNKEEALLKSTNQSDLSENSTKKKSLRWRIDEFLFIYLSIQLKYLQQKAHYYLYKIYNEQLPFHTK